MSNRITRRTVTLAEAFAMASRREAIPAGCYEITTEEEPLGDLMFAAYRRVSTTIYLPLPAGKIGLGEILDVDPAKLNEFLLRTETPHAAS